MDDNGPQIEVNNTQFTVLKNVSSLGTIQTFALF